MTNIFVERRNRTVWRVECHHIDRMSGKIIPVKEVEFESRQKATGFVNDHHSSSNESRWILSEFDVSWDELFVLSTNSWMGDPAEGFDPRFEYRHIASEVLMAPRKES